MYTKIKILGLLVCAIAGGLAGYTGHFLAIGAVVLGEFGVMLINLESDYKRYER